jgi:glycosyltransferase involved in cell wall biosynthesis
MADCVLASNAFMADWIDLPDKTVIMPTVVDYGAIPVREYTIGKEKVTIGWTGQVYQLEYIRPLFPVLRELSKDSKVDVLFHTSSIKPTEELAEMGIKIIPFDPRREFELLQSIDIGLMPMPKTTFNLGKCPLKLIQYMASGAAVVCSPVGSNMEMIQEGVQGYFAGTPTEWYERLKLLIQNLDKRIAMGRAGRRRVEEQYSTKAQWPHFKETVMRLLEKPS